MSIRIALAGNPNCGKTTIFNALTGSTQYVGNWPGVTVEKKEGKLKGHKDIMVVDLPGIYSLSPYTLEEVVTRDFLLHDTPNVIINIVDASNLERNLYLTTQLLELGVPVVLALNMMDIIEKNGDTININQLSKHLGCPVIPVSALKNKGLDELIETAQKSATKKSVVAPLKYLSAETETAIKNIEALLTNRVADTQLRWYAVKLFERDEKVLAALSNDTYDTNAVESIATSLEESMDDDTESIITNERYQFITSMIGSSIQKKHKGGMTTSDKIDNIVTNRFFALPIFAAIMFVVYYVSIQTIGDWTIGWVEGLFEWISGGVEGLLVAVGAADWLISLILDGIIGGVGAVLGFVPQLMILFLFLSILEDCGYMARVAFIMDRIFRKFGLSGKSFIPMLIGSGCGVPAIMASRTIENEKDRRMTIMVTTFIPCGAKLPIIALIAGALFPTNPWIAPSAYFIGVGSIILSCLILKRTSAFKGDPAPFVMELPQYHLPGAKGVFIHMWDRAKAFIIKAGTIIFVACAVIWFLQSFDWSLQMVEDSNQSILATIGNIFAPIFAPLGFGTWEAAVGTITGLVAKENVVATLGVLYGIGEVAENDISLLSAIAANFTPASAYAFMVFNLLCAPCFAAIGAIAREMNSFKWTMATIAYQTGFAYIVALLVYQIGSRIIG